MTKRNKGLILAFVALLAVSTAASVTAHRQCPYLGKRLLREVLRQSYTPSREVEFRWKMSASGTTPDGARFDDTQYIGSDCVKVDVTYYSFSSPGNATEHFNNSVKTAHTIYAQNTTRDEKGNVTDQRAVLSPQSQKLYEILHWNGTRVLQIESSSLNHAIEYERRLGITVTPILNREEYK
jgi:hypothetical protein